MSAANIESDGYWEKKNVLIVGASGFLGGWLTKRLVEEGGNVHCLVRNRNRKSQLFLGGLADRVTMIEGAAEDERIIAQTFDKTSFEAVFHLASLVDVNAALQRPLEMFRSSVGSTILILEQIRQKSPQSAVVIASSDKAYGAQEVPFRESQPLLPGHPYEIAKAAQDLMAQFYGGTHNLNVCVTRCGNYFGGWDFAFERIIPYCVRESLQKRAPVLRSDGKFTRDFLYIEDGVDATLLLARKVLSDPRIKGQAFNFSHEVDVEIGNLATIICRKINPNLTPVIQGIARTEIRHMRLDTTKAREMLGWKATTGFMEGLDKTIAWYRENQTIWNRP